MKKLAWLLALPYVVTVSTGPEWIIERRVGTMQCPGTQQECEDLAAALNEAHEWRTHKFTGLTSGPCPGDASLPCGTVHFSDDKDSKKADEKFNYRDACGQDDCGKDSQ